MDANKWTEPLLSWLKMIILHVTVLWLLGACTYQTTPSNSGTFVSPTTPITTSTLDSPHTSFPSATPTTAITAIPVTVSPKILPTPLSDRETVMVKVEETSVLSLKWEGKIDRFIYAQYNSPNSWDPSDISWWAFNPVLREKESFEEPSALYPSDEMKQRLDIYDDYVNLSPSKEHLVYVRAQKADEPGAPLPMYDSVELWHADASGEHLTKLGDLPLLWDDVVWLDGERSVLVVIHYENFDAGVSAFIFTIDGNSSISLFEESTVLKVVQGTPMTISVSPNGHWIAFTTFAGKADLDDGIWVIDRITNSLQRIDSADARVKPKWSKDSLYLYYIQNDRTYLPGMSPDTEPVIARFEVGTGQIYQLTFPGEIDTPLISEWAVSEDGRYFLISADSALGFLEGGLWLVALNND
jgi:hypothetical protein